MYWLMGLISVAILSIVAFSVTAFRRRANRIAKQELEDREREAVVLNLKREMDAENANVANQCEMQKPTSPPLPRRPRAAMEHLSRRAKPATSTNIEPSTDDTFVQSAILGYALNDGLVGGMLGGSMAGGFVGDIANDGVIGQVSEPTHHESASISHDRSPSMDSASDSGSFSCGSDMGGSDF